MRGRRRKGSKGGRRKKGEGEEEKYSFSCNFSGKKVGMCF